MTASLLFVGESPPAGSPPDFRPFDCASGTRLANVLGLVDRETLLEHVPMMNLFVDPTGVPGAPKWVPEDARAYAHRIVTHQWVDRRGAHNDSIVALGQRVADAFDVPTANGAGKPRPAVLSTWRHDLGPLVTYVPHPSGASQALNSPAMRANVRQALLPELVLGCPTLRPWHFRLDDAAVLRDLAVAVAPLWPAVGAAALLWSRAQHVARQARLASPLLAKVDAVSGQAAPSFATWDHDLTTLRRWLEQPQGPRRLAGTWATDAVGTPTNLGDRFLLKLAENHDALVADVPRSVVRATLLRYAMEDRP